MNDETTDLDQVDEEVLAYTVSDEALEVAARGAQWTAWTSTALPPERMGLWLGPRRRFGTGLGPRAAEKPSSTTRAATFRQGAHDDRLLGASEGTKGALSGPAQMR
jgi:hypothetical protein